MKVDESVLAAPLVRVPGGAATENQQRRGQESCRLLRSRRQVLGEVTACGRCLSASEVPLLRHAVGLSPTRISNVATLAARLVAWQIYWINGTLTSSNYAAKVYSAVYRLLGMGDESAVIVIHAEKPITGDPDAPLEAFMQANFAAIDALLQQVSASR